MNEITITTERPLLVPIGMEQLTTTHEYSSDPENTRFMMFLPFESVGETEEFLREAEEEWRKDDPLFYEFAVMLGGEHIGGASIYLGEDGSAELGWILARRYHGHGYATEAASALLGFARDRLGITHFIAHCDAENDASRRVMEKLGMTLTAVNEGRKNRSSDEERTEYQYELYL